MSKRTTLLLLVGVALLAFVVHWQQRREAADLGAIDVPLFEGVRVERVVGMRIDHLERSMQLRLERDARGGWFLTDPIQYPANLGLVGVLLDVIGQSRALIVPALERDPHELGFEPPRALFVVEEERDGAIVEHRLEIGHLDPDQKRVNVRKDGRYLRILRKLDTALKNSVNDFRSRRILPIDAEAVVELNRSGRWQPTIQDRPVDLRLNAVRDGASWRALQPHEVALDPLDLGVVLFGAATLEVDLFLDDSPLSLAEHGLEDPELRIELVTASGMREALRLSRGGFGRSWKACREGDPHVFGIAGEEIARLVLPFEELLDRRFLRVLKSEIDALVLECDDARVRVERAPKGWKLAGPAGALEADAERVERILSRLEHQELERFLPDERFPEAAPRRGVYVERAGELSGGRLAPAGAEGLALFQRLGDEIPARVDPWLLELACTRAAELRSLRLIAIEEVQLRALTLTHAGRSLAYLRSEQGRWSRAGSEEEARELLPVLDPLIFLRASEHLPPAGSPLVDAVEVRMQRRDGSELPFLVALERASEGGRAVVEIEGERSLLAVQDLHQRLRSLFDL